MVVSERPGFPFLTFVLIGRAGAWTVQKLRPVRLSKIEDYLTDNLSSLYIISGERVRSRRKWTGRGTGSKLGI